MSSSQLTEARDRVRSFGGYNSARAPPRSSTKHRHYVFRHVDHPRYCEPCGHHRIVGGSHPATRAPKLKKKFLKRLLHSEPITPKHQPAKTIGGQFGSHVSEEVRAFFADFADFANVVNWWLADEHVDSRWRLQELPETELSLHGVFDCGPIFGRSYAVFYNQVRVGELEVTPLFKYNPDRPELITRIHLEYVRLLSLETIRDFFHAIGMHACCYKNSKEYFEAQQAIDRALTKALWRSNRVDVYNINAPDYGEIDLQLDGVASWYLERREALRKQEAARALFRPRP